MINSILQMINEFVIKPVLIINIFTLFLSFIMFFFLTKKIKTTIIYSFYLNIVEFFVLLLSILVSVQLNNPKWQILGYIILFHAFYYIIQKTAQKYVSMFTTFLITSIFFIDIFIVEKILFE